MTTGNATDVAGPIRPHRKKFSTTTNAYPMNSRILTSFLCGFLLTGCASIINDKEQNIQIETSSSDGVVLNGAKCNAVNDEASAQFLSGQTVKVHRSNKPLNISCSQEGHAQARGKVESSTGVGSTTMNYFMGGLVFGSTAQAVDHAKGTAYHYPVWVRLIFGQSLVFNRSDEKDGQPTLGKTENKN